MPLKTMDDKSRRLALLDDLHKSALLDARQKKWLREEVIRTRKGIQGEKESAYYLDEHFKGGENHVVLHDLRLVYDGDVAQIDHLVINRILGFYLIETKNYAGNLIINDHGEFTVDYGDGERYGIPSPIEQSRRHERVLQRMLERLEITNRTGKPFDFHHVVMVHPKAIITRPSAKQFDSSCVIKADQFPSWRQQYVEKAVGAGAVLNGLLNVRSLETITEWGEKLRRQHRPADLLQLPEFMKPNVAPSRQSEKPVPPSSGNEGDAKAPAKRLICANCGTKISFPEGKFCWNNEKRFAGLQYCRTHQALFPS